MKVSIPTRYVVPWGTRASLRIYWYGYRTGPGIDDRYVYECPGPSGKGKSYHNAKRVLGDHQELNEQGGAVGALRLDHKVEDYADPLWPIVCEYCGAAVPDLPWQLPGAPYRDGQNVIRQIFTECLYQGVADGKVGELEVGDLFYATWYGCADRGGACIHGWTNCDGRHLMCVLPTRDFPWDIDGRASNCDQKDETTHRCWVRHGKPEAGELVHVDKVGHTCGAGAGSIQIEGFHGFLHHGKITNT